MMMHRPRSYSPDRRTRRAPRVRPSSPRTKVALQRLGFTPTDWRKGPQEVLGVSHHDIPEAELEVKEAFSRQRKAWAAQIAEERERLIERTTPLRGNIKLIPRRQMEERVDEFAHHAIHREKQAMQNYLQSLYKEDLLRLERERDLSLKMLMEGSPYNISDGVPWEVERAGGIARAKAFYGYSWTEDRRNVQRARSLVRNAELLRQERARDMRRSAIERKSYNVDVNRERTKEIQQAMLDTNARLQAECTSLRSALIASRAIPNTRKRWEKVAAACQYYAPDLDLQCPALPSDYQDLYLTQMRSAPLSTLTKGTSTSPYNQQTLRMSRSRTPMSRRKKQDRSLDATLSTCASLSSLRSRTSGRVSPSEKSTKSRARSNTPSPSNKNSPKAADKKGSKSKRSSTVAPKATRAFPVAADDSPLTTNEPRTPIKARPRESAA